LTKLITFSDIHFGKKSNSNHFNEQAVKTVDQIIDTAKEYDIKYGCFCGDWFNDRINIKSNTLHYSSIALSRLNTYFKSVGGKLYFILGNHDLYYRNSRDITGLRFLDEYSNIEIIDEPQDVTIETTTISLFPWMVESDDIAKHITDAKGTYAFCHAEFRNFKWNSNSSMLTKGLPLDAFSKFKHVYSGHYHLRQSEGNITYLGSPQQQDFGDSNCERGWNIIDLSDGSLTFFENVLSSKYHIIKLSELGDKISLVTNNHVKIVEDIETHSDQFNQIYEALMNKSPASLVFEHKKSDGEETVDVSDEEIESLEHLLISLVDESDERIEQRKELLVGKI